MNHSLNIERPPVRTPAVVLVSGGLDSVTLAEFLAALEVPQIHVVSIDYGQRHVKELASAVACASRLEARRPGINYARISMQEAMRGFYDCALFSSSMHAVPDGHYTDATMRSTVVPNRNAMMLTVAFAFAVRMGAGIVATAVHAGDHTIYPDCRPEFIDAFARMQTEALRGVADVTLFAPFARIDKAEIVRVGSEIGVPYGETWSCYKGGAFHCGTCGTCVERREAFILAGVADPTVYESTAPLPEPAKNSGGTFSDGVREWLA